MEIEGFGALLYVSVILTVNSGSTAGSVKEYASLIGSDLAYLTK
jgi:hypothetical protein